VNLCVEILATPTTEEPVVTSVLNPSSITVMRLCAGQNPVGFHCSVSSLSHSNWPLGRCGAAMVSAR